MSRQEAVRKETEDLVQQKVRKINPGTCFRVWGVYAMYIRSMYVYYLLSAFGRRGREFVQAAGFRSLGFGLLGFRGWVFGRLGISVLLFGSVPDPKHGLRGAWRF